MGYIQEEIEHPSIDNVTLSVDDKENGSMRNPLEICYLDISFPGIRTPNQLISLCKWVIENANRIKIEYTSTGRKKSLKIPQKLGNDA